MCFWILQTYVVFLTEMGGVWVERNLSTIAKHVLELVAHPKTTQSHIDAVYARKCVGFIFRSVFGKLLGESAQFVAAKHLCQLITVMLTTPLSAGLGGAGVTQDREGEQPLEGALGGATGGGGGGEKEKEKERDKRGVTQHAVICSMLEIGQFHHLFLVIWRPPLAIHLPHCRCSGVQPQHSGPAPSHSRELWSHPNRDRRQTTPPPLRT